MSALYKRACIINEITPADGSYLGSVPPLPRFAAGPHVREGARTLLLFYSPPPPPPVKCGPSQPVTPFTHSFHSAPISLSLWSILFILPLPLLHSSFIHTRIWPRRPGFQAKINRRRAPPPHLPKPCLTTTTTTTPPPPPVPLYPLPVLSLLVFYFIYI